MRDAAGERGEPAASNRGADSFSSSFDGAVDEAASIHPLVERADEP
jgi:hypothetical protein